VIGCDDVFSYYVVAKLQLFPVHVGSSQGIGAWKNKESQFPRVRSEGGNIGFLAQWFRYCRPTSWPIQRGGRKLSSGLFVRSAEVQGNSVAIAYGLPCHFLDDMNCKMSVDEDPIPTKQKGHPEGPDLSYLIVRECVGSKPWLSLMMKCPCSW
jgi:hypothetical protein